MGFWDRLGAAVLDAGLPFLLALLVAGSRGVEALGVYLVLLLVIHWLMLGTLGGTIGMLVLGLVVVDCNGRRISIWRAGLRMAGWALSSLLLGTGHLLIASRRDGRGLHDLLAGTMVVYDREFQALQSDAGD